MEYCERRLIFYRRWRFSHIFEESKEEGRIGRLKSYRKLVHSNAIWNTGSTQQESTA
jgi:hypothetical protein